jgi:hypothetical protein
LAAVASFRVFGSPAHLPVLAVPTNFLSWNYLVAWNLDLESVPTVLVADPTVLLAISSALWSSAFGGGLAFPKVGSPEFLPVGLSSRVLRLVILASRRSRPAPLVDFVLPTAQVRSKGPPFRQGSTPAFVPPSGFGYPLDGLLPLKPSEPCFRPPRPWDSPLRSLAFPPGTTMSPSWCTHLLFLLHLMRRPKSTARQCKPQLLGFDPDGGC